MINHSITIANQMITFTISIRFYLYTKSPDQSVIYTDDDHDNRSTFNAPPTTEISSSPGFVFQLKVRVEGTLFSPGDTFNLSTIRRTTIGACVILWGPGHTNVRQWDTDRGWSFVGHKVTRSSRRCRGLLYDSRITNFWNKQVFYVLWGTFQILLTGRTNSKEPPCYLRQVDIQTATL